jgi:hypothetical protein
LLRPKILCILELMKGTAALVVAIGLVASAAAADEIRLKDGTKINGTIVGFEENSFKVQTSYGFALVRKDKIAVIVPAEPKPEPKKEAATNNQKTASPAAPAAPQAAASGAPSPSAPRVEKKENSTAAPVVVARKEASPPAQAPNISSLAAANEPRPTPSATTSPATTTEEPAPPPMREEVQGNLYINYTYGFRMYKPPGWHVIEGAQRALPTAIVAMGTGDDTTLLVVGREQLKGSLESHATATEQQLREIYENYRRLSEQHSRVAGLPALERRYRGTVDDHDWSGVVVSLVRGNEVYTVLGMTYADSDLIQIQENVIAKTIASLEFTSK